MEPHRASLDGHTINGRCSTFAGIRVISSVSQVRVLGPGTISNFDVGLRAAGNSKDSFAKFTTVTANCPFLTTGFEIVGPASHWELQGNVVREPGSTSVGILLQSTDHNHLVANDVNDTIALVDSSNNVIANNISDDNNVGIGLERFATGSNNNEIHANTTNNNTYGIEIFLGSKPE